MANIPFAQRLRKNRIRNGLSQADLGNRIGVTGATISNWETGKIVPSGTQKKAVWHIVGPNSTPGTSEEIPAGGPPPFGAWLNRERQRLNLSVSELAEKAGVSAPAIYNIESGRIANPRDATVSRIENALNSKLPTDAREEIREDATIKGLGELVDFDLHDDEDLPSAPGIYVLYDVSERPVYVGQGSDIRARLRTHKEKFWYRPPIVQTGAFVKVDQRDLREKVETLLIRFLRSNAVINKQNVDR